MTNTRIYKLARVKSRADLIAQVKKDGYVYDTDSDEWIHPDGGIDLFRKLLETIHGRSVRTTASGRNTDHCVLRAVKGGGFSYVIPKSWLAWDPWRRND